MVKGVHSLQEMNMKSKAFLQTPCETDKSRSLDQLLGTSNVLVMLDGR